MAGGNGFQRKKEEEAKEAFNKQKELEAQKRGGGNGFQRPKK